MWRGARGLRCLRSLDSRCWWPTLVRGWGRKSARRGYCTAWDAEMLNFGALIAFMGVNLAAFYRYHVREGNKKPLPPLLITGVVIVLALLPGQNFWLLGIAGVGLVVLALWTPPSSQKF